MSPESILQAVSQASGISVDVLLGKNRQPHLVRPRQLAMVLLRDHCGLPWDKAGLIMEREQSTIWEGYRSALRRMEKEPDYRALYDRALSRLTAPATKDQQA